MTTRNANLYATVTEAKVFFGIPSTDTTEDEYIGSVLEQASRSLDDLTGRFFYPNVDTLYFDTPVGDSLNLWYDDLLEPITITNGSYGALSSSDYTGVPYNHTPYIDVKLKPNTGVFWESDTDNITTRAVSILGFWGYRSRYARDGWHTKTTLSADEDSDTLALSVTDDTGFVAGDIIRIDNEIMLVASASGAGVLNITERGWNGSTAAAHSSGAAVKRWYTEPAIVRATLIQAQRLYRRKDSPFGVVGSPNAGGELRLLQRMDADVEALIRPFVRLY